jgi:hypothetical protein
MTDEEIFRLAEQHADWDDFGRWMFKNDYQLLKFVGAIAEAKKPKMRRATREEKIVNPGVYEVPVAWAEITKDYVAVSDEPFENAIPLYTTPPERKWVWLTYDEINEIYDEYGQCRKYGYEEAIQEKLKEKNI